MYKSMITKKSSSKEIKTSGICAALSVMGFSFLFLLVGCASMNNQFDCPMKSGIRCESLDSVNARIDRGELRGETSDNNSSWKTGSLEAIEKVNLEGKEESQTTGPHRYPESVQRVLIAPFEDSQGNYHTVSSVYAVMNSGHWNDSHPAGNSGGTPHA